jgi:hypothetical protein
MENLKDEENPILKKLLRLDAELETLNEDDPIDYVKMLLIHDELKRIKNVLEEIKND